MTQINRRDVLTRASLIAAATMIPVAFGATAADAEGRPDGKKISPESALKALKSGNLRHRHGKSIRKSYAPKGEALSKGQWPIAAIVGCADSRVHPDEIFDIAPANLFVVRNAGNVIDDDVLGSLEYAVEHLGVELIVTCGHSLCGAVKATEAVVLGGDLPGGHINNLVEKIRPALAALPVGHTLQQAVTANSKQSAQRALNDSEILLEAKLAGKLHVVSATYSLVNKKVYFYNEATVTPV